MKKTVFAAIALGGIMALSLCACDSGTKGEGGFAQAGDDKTVLSGVETYAGLSSAESVYAMGAVTTAGYFAAEKTGSVSAVSAKPLSAVEEGGSAAKEEAAEFNEYLGMIESFLDEAQLKTTLEQNTDEEFADYEIKLTVTGKDLGGEDVVHVLYYTETFTRTETKIKEGESETKTSYSLNGVMALGGETYTVRGERKEEEESEDGETETESEIIIRAYPDASDFKTYVQMAYGSETEEEQGKSEEEHSYVYTIVENGVLQEKTVVKSETETDDSETQTKYTVLFYGAETGARSIYSLERETDADGRETLKVFYKIYNGTGNAPEQGIYRVEKDENGDYVYTFLDGSVKHYQGYRR